MANKTDLTVQTMELLKLYHQRPSVQLRNRLVQLNMGLVRKVAHRVARQCAQPYEDLEQCGYLGLISAIERFNPTQGCAFSSFAVPYIRGEILHFLRDRAHSVRIPRRWQQLHQDGQRVRKELATTLGHPPSEQQIAQHLEISLDEWRSVRLAMINRAPLSLNSTHPRSQSADLPVSLQDTLPDLHTSSQRDEDSLALHQALDQLEERTRQMIEGVFINQLTRQEVARRIGVSPITVSRHIQQGIDQLVQLLQQPAMVSAEV